MKVSAGLTFSARCASIYSYASKVRLFENRISTIISPERRRLKGAKGGRDGNEDQGDDFRGSSGVGSRSWGSTTDNQKRQTIKRRYKAGHQRQAGIFQCKDREYQDRKNALGKLHRHTLSIKSNRLDRN